jgi:hypothetical protein
MITPLGELATQVRSKNAGPFWLTMDIFFADDAALTRASRSPLTDPATIGRMYEVDPAQVKVFVLADLLAIKISVPRPVVQGSLQDRDMHAGQQYVPLLGLPVE